MWAALTPNRFLTFSDDKATREQSSLAWLQSDRGK